MTDVDEHPKQFKCAQCGGSMKFAPGQASLACPYCGSANAIPQSEELDFHAFLQHAADEEDAEERHLMTCGSCGGETTFDETIAADLCPFCGSDLICDGGSSRAIKPKSLLQFDWSMRARAKSRAKGLGAW